MGTILTLLLWALPALSDDKVASVPPVAAEEIKKAPEYQGEALKLKEHMDVLFESSRKINDSREKTSSRKRIEGALDWDRVAEECLGKARWKKESQKNRDLFRDLLRDVIVKTAYTRLDKFWIDAKGYQFDSINVKGNGAEMQATFFVKQDSFSLGYYLLKRGAAWFIYDLSFEGLRYGENINEQIDAFLKEKTFTHLIEKLRKRREVLDSDKKPG